MFFLRYLIYWFWIAYYYTIGKIVFEVQWLIDTRKSKRAWKEFYWRTFIARGNDRDK